MSSDSNLTGLKRIPRIYPIILWLLTLSFFLRVLGQILIAFFQVSFLPPMPHWYSGLLSYPILLCLQILILIIQIKINLDFSQSSGYFAQPKPKNGKLLQRFSYPYAVIMSIRYIIAMTFYPERRWFGEGTIPIIFHFVLAGYLFTWGHFYTYFTSSKIPGKYKE